MPDYHVDTVLGHFGSDQYDANGNTKVSGATSDQYDYANHLVDRNNGQISMTYDGDGNRFSKSTASNGQTTYYLVDELNPSGSPQVVEELDNTRSVVRAYTYGSQLISVR